MSKRAKKAAVVCADDVWRLVLSAEGVTAGTVRMVMRQCRGLVEVTGNNVVINQHHLNPLLSLSAYGQIKGEKVTVHDAFTKVLAELKAEGMNIHHAGTRSR